MKRKNKITRIKKILKVLPAMAGVTAVLYLVLLVKDVEVPTVLPVENIQIDGDLHFLSENDISEVVKQNITGGYFTVDLSDMRQALLDIPWIKSVSLRRRWPASLNVSVVEQVPVAYWNNNAYLSEQGDVFRPQLVDKSLNLPALNGPEGQHKNVWKFMNVLYKETALLEFEVVRLTLDERRAWQMSLVNSMSGNKLHANGSEQNTMIEVKLGRFAALKRMQRFVRVLPVMMASNDNDDDVSVMNDIAIIDMRYPNGFAVKMNNNKNKIQRLSHGFERSLNKAAPKTGEV